MTMMLTVMIMMMRNDEPVLKELTNANGNLTIFRRLSWSTMSKSGQASAICSTVQTFLNPNLLIGDQLKKLQSQNENCNKLYHRHADW